VVHLHPFMEVRIVSLSRWLESLWHREAS